MPAGCFDHIIRLRKCDRRNVGERLSAGLLVYGLRLQEDMTEGQLKLSHLGELFTSACEGAMLLHCNQHGDCFDGQQLPNIVGNEKQVCKQIEEIN